MPIRAFISATFSGVIFAAVKSSTVSAALIVPVPFSLL
jgi:hypothetical protein